MISCKHYFDNFYMYSREHNKRHICLPMKQNEYFLREHGDYKITARLTPSLVFYITSNEVRYDILSQGSSKLP